jgi:hypothetical protein
MSKEKGDDYTDGRESTQLHKISAI